MKQSAAMAKVMVTKPGWRCERCQYEWIPRIEDFQPAVCPHCKSPYWNRPRRVAKKKEKD